MELKEITNRKVWQKFFNEVGSPSFLQSWEWGEFQRMLKYDVLRLGIYSNNKLLAIAQIIKIKSRRGNFLFLPHGPIITQQLTSNTIDLKSIISQFLNFSISISKDEGFSFIRIAPILEDRGEYRNIFQDLGFKEAPIYMHAETVWVLPLNKAEEELLSNMRKTTRYLIKKAIREGVVIEKRTDKKAIDDFYEIYQETARREKFVPFTKEFIKKEFEAFNKSGNAIFLFGKIKTNFNLPTDRQGEFQPISTCLPTGKANFNYLAGALIIFTPSTAFYHQGASIHTKIPVPYLLQWEAIKEAKKRGCHLYNFWGIYDEKSDRTPKSWAGLTLFKTGFGGQAICYLPTQDYILSSKYYLTYLMEKYLMWKRKYFI